MATSHQTDDAIRDKSRQLILQALEFGGNPAQVDNKDLPGLSAEIEEAIYEANNYETQNEYRILNLKDKNNPLLTAAVLTREISATEFAHMTSEEMASPQRRQENVRIRRNSLTQTVGVNDLQPVKSLEGDVPGENGMDEMGRSGQRGLEYQRPV